jgi:hypothetical protein
MENNPRVRGFGITLVSLDTDTSALLALNGMS